MHTVTRCGRAVTSLIQRSRHFTSSSKHRLPFSKNRIYIYDPDTSFDRMVQNICQVPVEPSTFNLLDRLIVARRKERKEKRGEKKSR